MDKAELFYNNSQFVEAIEEYKHIQEISYNKFPYEYAMAQNNLGNAYLDLAKEWLKNNSKFSLWGWLYNSISPNKHQRQYR